MAKMCSTLEAPEQGQRRTQVAEQWAVHRLEATVTTREGTGTVECLNGRITR